MVKGASKNAVNNKAVEWIVLSKAPVPGLVKTRLIPTLGEQGACDLYEQLLLRLQGVLKFVTAKQSSQVALWISGDAEHEAFRSWSSLATFYQQPEGIDGVVDLGERMAVAVQSSLARGFIPVLIGVDVPGLDEAYLGDCIKQLGNHDLVVSPAEDGGYGLLGMKQYYSELFVNKHWGTDIVFESTRSDIVELNINAAYLPRVWDVDEFVDVERFQNLVKN
jgi:rSAM/selenodomain-associated transferase 1